MEKIKVNVISGFLGAGKTTAIIKLLEQKNKSEKWAVIVNEFGEVSIDFMTLLEYSEPGEVYDISGGCICCTAKTYFHRNLSRIVQEKKYNRIIIEPTGLGGPDMVAELILSIPELELLPSICLIDSTSLDNKRIQMIPLFRKQIQGADILVLSKCDLIEDDQKLLSIMDKVQQDFPGKLSYSRSANGRIDVGLLDSGKPIQKKNNWEIDLSKKEIKSKTYPISKNDIFDVDHLIHFFQRQQEIIRAKAYVRGKTGWQLVNYTLTGYHIEICRDLPQGTVTIFAEFEGNDFFSMIDAEIEKLKVEINLA